MRLLGCTKSKGAIFGAVPFYEPEIFRLLVVREVDRAEDINDALSIGRKMRVIDVPNGGEIFRLERPGRICA